VTHDRPARAATVRRTSSIWGPAVWERSGRLPCATPLAASERRPGPTNPSVPTTCRGSAGLRLYLALSAAFAGLARRSLRRGDRGDVPGWVLVTLMTAGLVLVLWGIARDRLSEVFNHAIDTVLGGG
jgi:hypothetical protein